MPDRNSDNPEVIERDIERTQDSIGDTVDKIEEKLTPSNITRSLLGDDGQEWVREGIRIARENPIPVAMIAIGAIWLLAGGKGPKIDSLRERLTHKDPEGLIPRSGEPAPIGPPPRHGEEYDRRESANAFNQEEK